MDLFSAGSGWEPLASRMRPRTLEEFIGQEHILGEGRLLRRAIALDQLSSIILSGPPGTGKTTLAQVIAQSTESKFFNINAVLSGVKEVREILSVAEETRNLQGRKSVLFVDEVHRWNKAQQDALLPWVENGTLILIGATTENPFFEVNRALVSRSRVFQLKGLEERDLRRIAERALSDRVHGYGKWEVVLETGVLEHLTGKAGGDARNLLNALELAVETRLRPPPPDGTIIHISLSDAEESIQERVALYDKDGDYHYDAASAFIKSLRGSDPDAALYWLAVMIRAGEDPSFLFRRMLITACEDVGLADPEALSAVTAAAAAFDRVGMPEGQYHLSFAALRLALAPKSNSTIGYFDAMKTLDTQGAGDVPANLKDASRDKDAFGHGKGYAYPHAFRDHWTAQNYLPSGQKGRVFYQPGSLGWEKEPAEIWQSRRELVEASLPHSETDSENFSWSPAHPINDASSPTHFWESIRLGTLRELGLHRTSRVWIARDRQGLMTMECLRRCTEGLIIITGNEQDLASVDYWTRNLPLLEKPFKLSGPPEPSQPLDAALFLLENGGDTRDFLIALKNLTWSEGAKAALIIVIPPDPKLAGLFPSGSLNEGTLRLLKESEKNFPDPEPIPGPEGWKSIKIHSNIPLLWNDERKKEWLDTRRIGKWAAKVSRDVPELWPSLRDSLMKTPDCEVLFKREAYVFFSPAL